MCYLEQQKNPATMETYLNYFDHEVFATEILSPNAEKFLLLIIYLYAF